MSSLRTLIEIKPSDPYTTAEEWDAYKRHCIHFDELDVDDKPGKPKVEALPANKSRHLI